MIILFHLSTSNICYVHMFGFCVTRLKRQKKTPGEGRSWPQNNDITKQLLKWEGGDKKWISGLSFYQKYFSSSLLSPSPIPTSPSCHQLLLEPRQCLFFFFHFSWYSSIGSYPSLPADFPYVIAIVYVLSNSFRSIIPLLNRIMTLWEQAMKDSPASYGQDVRNCFIGFPSFIQEYRCTLPCVFTSHYAGLH